MTRSQKSSPIQGVFTIPPHRPFLDDLATGFLTAYPTAEALGYVTLLLPNRRAAATLREIFIEKTPHPAFLLPRIAAIGDASEEDSGQEEGSLLESDEGGPELSRLDSVPPIDSLRRQALLAREIGKWQTEKGDPRSTPDLAMRLARELIDFLDEMQIEGCSLESLASLDQDEYPEHWELTRDFLGILETGWPEQLAKENTLDPVEYHNRRLESLAEFWQQTPPNHPVIIAGSLGTRPATAHLMATLARIPNAAVILPGLDRELDEESWEALPPSHPQYGLKQLLHRLEKQRHTIPDWPASLIAQATRSQSEQEKTRARATLLRNALLPTETTPCWALKSLPRELAWEGLTLIESQNPHEEALSVALILRETLETPGKKAALVTTDRDLARRVTSELRRWNIIIDDSAGQPLSMTRAGAFLRLVIEAVAQDLAPVPLASLCQHPLASGGRKPEMFRALARRFIHTDLRGLRPPAGPEGLRIVRGQANPKQAGLAEQETEISAWLETLLTALAPLSDKQHEHAETSYPASELIVAHQEVATRLADSDTQTGEARLWQGEDGKAAATLMETMKTAFADSVSEHCLAFTLKEYAITLGALMAEVIVRPTQNRHPRLSILGPLEARLQRYDRIVMSGLNEGSWPGMTSPDPWMGRHMRETIGLPPPEKRIGLAAHDFTQLAAGPEVILTRCLHKAGAPTEASRWWRRLALFAPQPTPDSAPAHHQAKAPSQDNQGVVHTVPYPDWAQRIDQPRHPGRHPSRSPEPKPPLDRRPDHFSATKIETLIKDPYAFYAREILQLTPKDPFDADPNAAERGLAIHKTLEIFIDRHPNTLPETPLTCLLDLGKTILSPLLASPSWKALWWPRFEAIAAWFIDWETRKRAEGITPLAVEVTGQIDIKDRWILKAKADRINRLNSGYWAILDYKTGTIPPWTGVKAGKHPQLALEAVLALKGGFKEIGTPPSIEELMYLRLTGKASQPGEEKSSTTSRPPINIEQLATDTLSGLTDLLTAYGNPEQGYAPIRRFDSGSWSHPFANTEIRPGAVYDHLARRKEWS